MNPTAALLEPEVRELIQEGRYSELRAILHELPFADVADIFSELEPSQAAVGFRFLKRDDAGEVFAYLSQEKQEQLIQELGADGAVRIVEAMNADDRAALLDELPAEVAQRLIASLSPHERKVTQAILGYPPKSVGRLMSPDYIRIRPEWTIAQALDHIRRYGKDAETINVVYVVDDKGVLIDDIKLRSLILADPAQPVETVMNRQFVVLKADDPQEEAVRLMNRYDRVALPVVDSRGVLVGIVTVDDVADVAEEEVTEDIQKLGGLEALDEPYMAAPILRLVRKRGTWLSLLFVSELLTTTTLGWFESSIEKAAVLALFIPVIISSGGNSGSQATTLVIRAMALRELTLADWWRVLRRELACGALLGVLLGFLGLMRIQLWGWLGWWHDEGAQRNYRILGVTIMASLIGVVLWGSVMGSMLPFLLKRCGLDPATCSAPFVATLVDVTGIIIYFTCAMLILRGTLL